MQRGANAIQYCFGGNNYGSPAKDIAALLLKAGSNILLKHFCSEFTIYQQIQREKVFTDDEILNLCPSFVRPAENILDAIKRGATVAEIEAIAATLESRTTAPMQGREINILSFAASLQRLDAIKALLALGFKVLFTNFYCFIIN